jgi:aromatic-L-amino-acid decarboxylase
MALRLDGVEAMQAMIRRHVDHAQRLAALVAADDRFDIVAPHPLNLLCLRLRGGSAATDELIERANATGRVLFTRTVLDDEVALRFSIGTRTTEWRHVEAAWQLLGELAGDVS